MTDDDAIYSDIARLALKFGEVKRATFHPDGVTAETDTTHSIMLALIACEINDCYGYGLSPGWLCAFAVVHDLVEAECGDTSTLGITAEERASKAAREAHALKGLRITFPGAWFVTTIDQYEAQRLPEARFIKLVDKVLPKYTHEFNHGIAFAKQGRTADEIAAIHKVQHDALSEQYGRRFPEVLALLERLMKRSEQVYRESNDVPCASGLCEWSDNEGDQFTAGAGDCDATVLPSAIC